MDSTWYGCQGKESEKFSEKKGFHLGQVLKDD